MTSKHFVELLFEITNIINMRCGEGGVKGTRVLNLQFAYCVLEPNELKYVPANFNDFFG